MARRKPHHRFASATAESLESRRYLSLSVGIVKGTLLLQATTSNDTITVDQTLTYITITLNAAVLSFPLGGVKGVQIKGDAGNDVITLTPAVSKPTAIFGGPGSDTITGSDHPCTLMGEAGNDILRGGLGKDSISGGSGTDTADYSLRTTPLRISLDGKPNDGALTGPAGPPENDNVSADCEIIKGGFSNDRLTGNNKPNTLIGGAGSDSLLGNGGNDVLIGGADADLLSGGEGDDLLIASDLTATDTVDGGAGEDSYLVDSVLGVVDAVLNCETELGVLGG